MESKICNNILCENYDYEHYHNNCKEWTIIQTRCKKWKKADQNIYEKPLLTNIFAEIRRNSFEPEGYEDDVIRIDDVEAILRKYFK